jgi:hypothetical protein
VTDVYGDVARSTYHSLQLTLEKRRSDDGLIVNFNYTFSRTEDNLSARTGYNFDQDWAVGVNDQPHVWNAMVVYNHAVRRRRASPAAAIRWFARSSRTGRSPASRSSGPAVRSGSIGAACNLPNRRHLLRRLQPELQRAGPHQRRLRRRRRPRLEPAAYIDRAAFQSPAPFTYGNTPRTLAFDLRNPSYFNQDLSVRRDFRISKIKLGLGVDVFNVFNTSSSEGSRPTSPTRTSAG